MASAAKPAPFLSEEEWAVVYELLDREHRELLTVTRHTDKREYRNQLKHRLDIVSALLERVSALRPPQ
jgi:hypothetical protein